MVTRPRHTAIGELWIMPTEQFYRNRIAAKTSRSPPARVPALSALITRR